MQIYGPTQVHGAQPISSPHATRAAQPTAAPSPAAGGDQLDISEAAQLMNKIHDLPEIRADRVSQLRQAIANGTYETADKLDISLERLLDEIA